MQKYLADILSVLALTMSAEGERVCIFVLGVKFNIFSSVIHSFDYAWATSFVLHLPCGYLFLCYSICADSCILCIHTHA